MFDTTALERILCALLIVLACSCNRKQNGGNIEPFNAELPDGAPVSLTLQPGTLLLTGVGESATIEPVFVDADGERVGGKASFESSAPDIVKVDDDGTVTAQAIGSARVTASADDLATTMVVYVARPAPDVVLIDSSNVVDGPFSANDDPLSLEYNVVLEDVELSEGDIIWATDDAPVTGRVVSLTDRDNGTEVALELTPIDEVFDELKFQQSFDLDAPELFLLNPDVEANYDISEQDGELVLSPKPDFMVAGLGSPMGTVAAEPFGCTTNLSVGSFPVAQNGAPSFSINRSMTFDIDYSSNTGLERLAAVGFVEAKVEIKPQITAQVEAKLTCDFEIARLVIPIGGPLSFFFGGFVPLGVGFELSAKLTAASFGFEASATKRVDFELGLECANGACAPIDPAFTPHPGMTDSKLVLPDPGQQFRAEMGLFAYGFAELSFGPPLFSQLHFAPFVLKGGVKQSANIAPASVQFADDMYHSDYKLDALVEFGTTLQLVSLVELLNINLAEFKLTSTLPISSSPSGPPGADGAPTNPLTVPSTIAPGTMLEGTVALDADHLTYLGIDNVTAVVVMRETTGGLEEVARVPGVSGQAMYTFEWTPSTEHLGAQTLMAFVETTLSGPFLLELSKDARRTVVVAERTAILVAGADATASYGEIYAIDPQTLEVTNLTNNDDNDGDPRWSSDHSEIFFTTNAGGGPSRLHRMNADGSNPRPILPVLTDEPARYEEWAVSPDGTKIAYVSESELWVAPLAGGAAINLTNGMNIDEYGGALWPFWAPDSGDISFALGAFDDDWIGIVSAGGGAGPGTLTAADGDVEPQWNQNRELLGAEWRSPDNTELFIATPGGGRTPVLTGYADYELYRWLPDGDRIVFVGYGPEFIPTLYLTDRAGNVTTLDSGMDRVSNIAPSPDGRSVAYAGRAGGRISVWVVDLESMTSVELVPEFDNASTVDW